MKQSVTGNAKPSLLSPGVDGMTIEPPEEAPPESGSSWITIAVEDPD